MSKLFKSPKALAIIAAVLVSVMVSTSASAGTAWAVAPLPGGSWVIAIDSLTMQGNEQTTGCKLYQFGDALFANSEPRTYAENYRYSVAACVASNTSLRSVSG